MEANETTIDTLPDELLCAVFVHVPCLVLRSVVPFVCHRWRGVASDKSSLARRIICIDAAKTMRRPSRWCDMAADAGHVRCLAYARHDLGLAWGATTCQAAARNGNIDCLKYAHGNGCPWNYHTTRVSAANGHLNCLLYAFESNCDARLTLVDLAARNGHASIVDAIYVTTARAIDADTCQRAVVGGHLDLIKHICRMGVTPNVSALNEAINCSNMDIVKYLVNEHGLRPSTWSLARAIRSGNLKLVRYLCESFGVGDKYDLYLAARKGRKRIALYLLSRCPSVNRRVTEWIVRRRWIEGVHLMCALHPHTADWIAACSIRFGCVRSFACALDSGGAVGPDLLTSAAALGRAEMIDLLIRRGVAWSVVAMHEAARYGHIEALARAMSSGMMFDADACMLAAANGHEETVRYLCNHRCPVDGRARAYAMAHNHHTIDRYLARRGHPCDVLFYGKERAFLRACRAFSRATRKLYAQLGSTQRP